MRQILKNRKGVTLIELLAVIVILGIIAAIAVPTIGGLINRQEEKAAQATYDVIVEAAELYITEEEPLAADKNLADLEAADYVDLKTNTFSMVVGAATITDPALIFFTIVGGVVVFEDSLGADATSFSINGHLVS